MIEEVDQLKQQINYKYRRQILRKETGHYFLRMVNTGKCIPKYNQEEAVKSVSYPESSIGLLEYYRNNKERKLSCGSIIGEKLILTFTPTFSVNDDINNYEKVMIKYLKNKQFKQKGVYQQKINKQKQKSQLDKSGQIKKQKQKFDQDNQIKQSQKMVEESLSQIPLYHQDFTQDSAEPHLTAANNSIYFYPNYPQNLQIRYKASIIHYFSHNLLLPENYRMKIPFISGQFALIELDTQQNLEQIYGSLGFDFNLVPQQRKNRPFQMGLFLDQNGNYLNRKNIFCPERKYLSGSPLIYQYNDRVYINQLSTNIFSNFQSLTERTFRDLQNYLFKSCSKFNIEGINIDDEPLIRSILRGSMPDLTYLSLKNSNICHENLQQMRTQSWGNIRNLTLDKNKLTIKMIGLLTRNCWINLNVLSLSETGLDNGGISAISKADWPNLSSLSLAKNYITSEGLQSIIFGNWVNLLGIDLRQNIFGNEDLKLLLLGDWTYAIGFDFSPRTIGANQTRTINQFLSKYPKLLEPNIIL